MIRRVSFAAALGVPPAPPPPPRLTPKMREFAFLLWFDYTQEQAAERLGITARTTSRFIATLARADPAQAGPDEAPMIAAAQASIRRRRVAARNDAVPPRPPARNGLPLPCYPAVVP